jgi:hypothetical protein
MIYDRVRARVVLFGGWDRQNNFFPDTWEWDGEAWTQVADSGPSGRVYHALAYDEKRQRSILFGGADIGVHPHLEENLSDTWSWDGVGWSG